ncbi:MAG: hypothetical protein AAFY56_15030 [Pseudomonadota bacterium]
MVEIALRLPLAAIVATMRKTAIKTLRTLSAGAVSDHWKEKVMLTYAGIMFLSSIKLAGMLFILGAIAILVSLALDRLSSGFETFIISGWGIIAALIAATLYLAVRKRLTSGQEENRG